MRLRVGLIITLLMLGAAGQGLAQQEATCDLPAVFKAASDLKSTGDDKTDMAALLTLRDQISAANIACAGLTFEGVGAAVLDPFNLPPGSYRLRLKVVGDALVVASVTSIGDAFCPGSLSNSSAESLLEAPDGCRAVLSVTSFEPQTAWTVTFEPLR